MDVIFAGGHHGDTDYNPSYHSNCRGGGFDMISPFFTECENCGATLAHTEPLCAFCHYQQSSMILGKERVLKHELRDFQHKNPQAMRQFWNNRLPSGLIVPSTVVEQRYKELNRKKRLFLTWWLLGGVLFLHRIKAGHTSNVMMIYSVHFIFIVSAVVLGAKMIPQPLASYLEFSWIIGSWLWGLICFLLWWNDCNAILSNTFKNEQGLYIFDMNFSDSMNQNNDNLV